MSKHILFYSNFCSFCKDLVEEIVKKKLRSKFVLICVEKHNVPRIVDRVPFIMTSDKKVVLENNIPVLINMLEQEQGSQNDVMSYASCQSTGFGSEYCTLNEENDVKPKREAFSDVLGYVFLDEDEKTYHLSAPSQESSRQSSSMQHIEKLPSIQDYNMMKNKIYNEDIYENGHQNVSHKGTFPTMMMSDTHTGMEDKNDQMQLPFKQVSMNKTPKMNDAMYENFIRQRASEVENLIQRPF